MNLTGITDFIHFLITTACIMDLMLLVLAFAGGFSRKRMRAVYGDRILKGMVCCFTFFLPLFTGYLFHRLTILHVRQVDYGPFDLEILQRYQTLAACLPAGYQAGFRVVFCVWFFGFLWFGISPICRNQRLLKTLVCHSKRVPQETFNGISACVYQSEMLSCPFSWGVFSRKIVLPAEGLNEWEKEVVFAHEWTHCRKRDSLYRFLLSCLCAVYWFNPGIYLLSEWFVAVNEMACDDIVLAGRSSAERYRYAELLYRFSAGEERGGISPGKGCGVSFSGSPGRTFPGRILAWRIGNIGKRRRENQRPAAILAAAVLFFAAFPGITMVSVRGMLKLEDFAAGKILEISASELDEKRYGANPAGWQQEYVNDTFEGSGETKHGEPGRCVVLRHREETGKMMETTKTTETETDRMPAETKEDALVREKQRTVEGKGIVLENVSTVRRCSRTFTVISID